ncbi:MAG: ATP-binding protein [Spirochaetia bacterium]
MKPLPIGITSLKKIHDKDMAYVDKTGIIESMTNIGGYYFLSRPRRFGKSLLVDTFKELFEGNEPLFMGKAIHNKWDWSKKYPVIKIDWASGIVKTRAALDKKIIHLLQENATHLGVTLDLEDEVSTLFEKLISGTAEKHKMPVVVLVDEYDKPMLDNIETPEITFEIREGLKNLYSVLKKMDEHLHFVFLTGVSKFSKVNIFSGVNNLNDLTLDPNYATICGYTHRDLETVFAEHLAGVDWEELQRWYNGYNFLGDAVYNPFDILLFISEGQRYRNFWFETGTPSFLVRLMQKNRYFLPDLENIEAGEELLSSFEVDTLQPVTLLFQTGYLSIKGTEVRRTRTIYHLGFPNLEVKNAFTDFLITSYTHAAQEKVRLSDSTWDALRLADMPALESTIRRLFAGIPWRNFTNNDLTDFEGFYASVLYAYFSAATATVIPEDTSSHGQADMTVQLEKNIYVMEIKVIPGELPEGGPNTALEQIQSRGYAEKYREKTGGRLFELGLIFSQAKRNLVRFDFIEL